jgi:hypothetical protein
VVRTSAEAIDRLRPGRRTRPGADAPAPSSSLSTDLPGTFVTLPVFSELLVPNAAVDLAGAIRNNFTPGTNILSGSSGLPAIHTYTSTVAGWNARDSPSLQREIPRMVADELGSARSLVHASLHDYGEQPRTDLDARGYSEEQVLGDWLPDIR